MSRRLGDWKTVKYVTIPLWWVRSVEIVSGKKLNYVLMHVSTPRIVIEPLFNEELAKKLLYRPRLNR